jgi:hypothetical protein
LNLPPPWTISNGCSFTRNPSSERGNYAEIKPFISPFSFYPEYFSHHRFAASLCLSFLNAAAGMEILGIAPNWLLIWLVSWSLNCSCLDSVVAGLAIGAIQDSLTSNYPSHIMVFGLIGFLTSRLHRQRYLKEELNRRGLNCLCYDFNR